MGGWVGVENYRNEPWNMGAFCSASPGPQIESGVTLTFKKPRGCPWGVRCFDPPLRIAAQRLRDS